VLVEGKAKGFRPESLFVWPGKARGGFGVVLARDNPELLWEVRMNLTPPQLESELRRMAARGYAPDQVVGYASGGASYYLVSWTRDPRPYPATGQGEPALEAIDEALEQLLIDRRVPSCTVAAFRNGRLVLSRGYGSADPQTREPIAPEAALPLGDVSVPFAAAAVHSLLAKKKTLREDTMLSDVLRASPGGAGASTKSPAPGSEPLKLTVAQLLDSVNPAEPKLGEDQREALTALAGPMAATDLELRGAILGRVLEAVAGAPPEQVITSEVLQPSRLAHVIPAPATTGGLKGLVFLKAPATDVGRFFLKYQFDGRPLAGRVKPAPGALIDRHGDSMALILRKDDLLFVVLLRLPGTAPPEFMSDLRACLDRAVDPLPGPDSPPAKRRSSAR
jgi:hypothetical protein